MTDIDKQLKKHVSNVKQQKAFCSHWKGVNDKSKRMLLKTVS